MKKFIYFLIIPIFVLFNDRVFADTGSYQYLYSYNNCFVSTAPALVSQSDNTTVFLYKLNSQDFTFTFLSGNRLRVMVSTVLKDWTNSTSCGLQIATSDRYLALNVTSPVIGEEYSFTNNYYGQDVDVYAYIYLSSITNTSGSISWGTGSVEPEPIPPYEYEFKGLIYVPEDDIYNKCYVVQNEDVIRGYDVIPTLSTSYNYRDYYINSSYIYKDGSGQWSQYSTLPVCLDSDILTNNLYYRLDFDRSLLIFFITSIFSIYLPIKLFSKIFRKGGL